MHLQQIHCIQTKKDNFDYDASCLTMASLQYSRCEAFTFLLQNYMVTFFVNFLLVSSDIIDNKMVPYDYMIGHAPSLRP